LKIDAEDASRVRHLEHERSGDRGGRRPRSPQESLRGTGQVRAIYEELVLKKPQADGRADRHGRDIAKAVPANFANAGKPVSIAPAIGNGNGHSNGNGAATKTNEKAAEAVAGD